MTAVLHLGDCLDVMKRMAPKSVDCFICDLPYGQLAGGYEYPSMSEEFAKKMGTMNANTCKWDVALNLEEFWKQVKRLAKNEHTPVLMFCNTKFGYDLIKSNEKWFRYDLVWDKEIGVGFLLANKMPIKSHEMIYVFSKKGAYYKRIDEVVPGKRMWTRDRDKPESVAQHYGVTRAGGSETGGDDGKRCALSVLNYSSKVGRPADGHPTEKPKDLYRWLLRRYVPEGGTVLDPTAGSFNSIIVAKELGLRAVGIEKDIGFYWKGVKKII